LTTEWDRERLEQEEGKTRAALELAVQNEQTATVQKREANKNAAAARVAEAAATQQKLLAEMNATAARTAEEAAKQNAELAIKQRNLALKTMYLVTDDIDAELRGKPALDKLRKKLLKTALDGLKEVSRSADKAGAIDHATVWVHLEMG